MDVATLVHSYGYAAVFVGSFLEGETVAALGGLAANRGYLALPWVIAIAAAGGFLSDQVFFGVGRLGGARVVARFPNLCPSVERATRLLHRYAVLADHQHSFYVRPAYRGPDGDRHERHSLATIRALELRRGRYSGLSSWSASAMFSARRSLGYSAISNVSRSGGSPPCL